ncbi:cinnamoyl-CoA reductase 1-like [Senna tora]|uniref:Cinnamoyl-CoA reductase 1-like n=1 Tax=Senna tora TaxID=362788 RepID=A0A834WXH0_9FABA|nr:cinnamoyl-CoA reductase 1-like [Senna tora]
MSISGEGKVVCVSGANGFIASWIVKFLLLRGYTVKGTVRDPNDPKKVEHLYKLEGAKERLQLIKADLLQEGSFDSAVEGCEGVFHTASPCFTETKDPQSQSVKRVVFTSSSTTVLLNGRPKTPEVIVDETWFSLPDLCAKYAEYNTLAEEGAWKFAKENNIDLVTIIPGMVIGPLLQPTLNFSAALIFNLINGAKTFPNFCRGFINVKDVANAHIQAFEISSANGRYCLVESVEHYSDVVRILHHLYPMLQLPLRCADDKPFMPKYQFSKEKAKTLGFDQFIPLDVSLKEAVESLKEKKFINF